MKKAETYYVMFLRPKPHDLDVVDKKVPNSMIFAMGILLIIVVIFGLFPDIVTQGISSFVGGIL